MGHCGNYSEAFLEFSLLISIFLEDKELVGRTISKTFSKFFPPKNNLFYGSKPLLCGLSFVYSS